MFNSQKPTPNLPFDSSNPTKIKSIEIFGTSLSQLEEAIRQANQFSSSKDCSRSCKSLIDLLAGLLSASVQHIKSNSVNSPAEEYHRQHSVVIIGLPESANVRPTQRAQEDLDQIKDIFDTAGIEALPTTHYRMGQAKNGLPRLLKVELPTRAFVRQLLAAKTSINKMPGLEKVRIRPSLTLEERKKREELIIQCTKKRQETNLDYVIYAGQIIEKHLITKEWKSKL